MSVMHTVKFLLSIFYSQVTTVLASGRDEKH